jgi:hypothetical protein
MKQVCLFVSELAIITRHNKYENVSSIIYKLWDKNFNDDFQYIQKLMVDKNINLSNDLETKDQCIERLSKNYNLDLKEHLNTCLESKDISKLNTTQEKLLQKCSDMNNEDMKKIKSSLISKTNTNFGTKYEGNSIDIYSQKTGNKVIRVEKFFFKKIGTSNDINWYIGGKVDGITEDKILIEVKNRTKKLFYNLRDYEKVQVLSYLKLLDLDMAHLVESLKNDRQEMNVIQIVFDTNFWKKEILNKIVLFIDFFNNFINNTEMKIKLLNNPEIIDSLYNSYINS